MADIERALVAVMRRYNARAKALDEATAERDRVIRDAMEAKMPRERITAITGLSRQRMDQIRNGAPLSSAASRAKRLDHTRRKTSA
jgi:acetyl-CoA acetyltransferase